jgi:hypothetical protein
MPSDPAGDDVSIIKDGVIGDETAEVVMADAANIVDLDDEDVIHTMPSKLPGRQATGSALAGPAVDVDSASESSSSSSSRSRSRSRANKRLGAAAAAALVTASAPLDVDECEKIVERQLTLSTAFARQLQTNDVSLVAIMAETGSVIDISTQVQDSEQSSVKISGTISAVGRAAWQLEQLQAAHEEEDLAATKRAERECLEQLEIPSQHLNAIVGPNNVAIAEIRGRCDGIMIAMQPPSSPGDPVIAFIGPGLREHVLHAKKDLQSRLQALEGPAIITKDELAKTGGVSGVKENLLSGADPEEEEDTVV